MLILPCFFRQQRHGLFQGPRWRIRHGGRRPGLMRSNAGVLTLSSSQIWWLLGPRSVCSISWALGHHLYAGRSFTLHESQETVKGFYLIPVVLFPKCLSPQGSCCCLESTQWLMSVNAAEVLHRDNSNHPTLQLLSRSAFSLTWNKVPKGGLSLGSAPSECLQLPRTFAIHHTLVAALLISHFWFSYTVATVRRQKKSCNSLWTVTTPRCPQLPFCLAIKYINANYAAWKWTPQQFLP